MKKMTMKVLMKNAWSFARNAAKQFGGSAVEYMSGALAKAWRVKREFENVKSMALEVKEWFMNKNFTSNEMFIADNSYQNDLVKETEKAVQIKFNSKYGTMIKWVPKKCLEV